MKKIGPELDLLTHRLTECPAEFYQHPIESGTQKLAANNPLPIDVRAIVCDHLRDLGVPLENIRAMGVAVAQAGLPHQRLIAVTVWLLREPWFMARPELAGRIGQLLADRLRELASTVRPELTVTDSDRREELARLCLRELGFRPAGETEEQARDRLNTLDSVERVHVVSETRAAESRARKIREAMARKRAQEAAARYAPE